MRIFNWVQRRFHNGALKDGLARNVKKAESITSEADKQALLKQVALVDVLDGWKDGILTIGTLGLDPLKPFNLQNDYSVLESEQESDHEEEEDEEEELEEDQEQERFSNGDDDVSDCDDNVEDEEVNPLLLTTFDRIFEDRDAPKPNVIPIKTGDPEGGKRGGRITLAELFLADSDIKKKPQDFGETEEAVSVKKPAIRAKNGLSFAKKLIPHVREEKRPMEKIHRLMRKMLKRKIHPDVEGKGHKKDYENKSWLMEVDIISKDNAAESVSLLQTLPGLAM